MTSSSQRSLLLELPREILVDSIIPLLDLKEFLALTCTCKYLHNLSSDDVYYRNLTYRVFNLPPQTIRETGWKEVFQKIYTSRVFTWGEYANGRLGHSTGRRATRVHGVSEPTEIDHLEEMNGAVVDIQAGGWSTSFLTSTGDVYIAGVLIPGYAYGDPLFHHLTFPPNPYTDEKVKIVEISSGRARLYGLDTWGRAWKWVQSAAKPATLWSLRDPTWRDAGYKADPHLGQIKRIRAGWTRGVAYVVGRGLVVEGERNMDEDVVIRGTASRNPKPDKTADTLDEKIGLVTEFIACEGFVVFLNAAGEVYAVSFDEVETATPVRLENFSAPEGSSPMSYISGTFRNFAVFNNKGLVYLGDDAIIKQALQAETADLFVAADSDVKPNIMPALQEKGIIKIAFGDYHSLALTSNGKVLTWGTEPQHCGAFGIGNEATARKRGAERAGNSYDLFLQEPVEIQWNSSEDPEKKEDEYFAFNIAAAGWHSGALVSVPDRKKGRGSESLEGRAEAPVPQPGIGPKMAVGAEGSASSSSSGRSGPPPPQPGAVPRLPHQTPFMINPMIFPLGVPMAQPAVTPGPINSHWEEDENNTSHNDRTNGPNSHPPTS